jgi:hypothetical protein
VDGGVFHPDAIVSLTTILFTNYVLVNTEKIKLSFSKMRIQVGILVLTVIASLFVFGHFSYQAMTSYLYILLISTLLFLYFRIYEVRHLAVIFIIFSFFTSSLDRDIFSYEKSEIEKNTPVYTFSYRPPSGIFQIEKETKIGNGVLYTTSSQKNTTVDELAKNIGSMTNIYPITIPWQTCIPSGERDIVSLNIHTKNSIPDSLFKNIHTSSVNFKLKVINKNGNWYDTSVDAEIEPCTPRVLNVLDETIKESIGDTTYFLSNLKIGEMD